MLFTFLISGIKYELELEMEYYYFKTTEKILSEENHYHVYSVYR